MIFWICMGVVLLFALITAAVLYALTSVTPRNGHDEFLYVTADDETHDEASESSPSVSSVLLSVTVTRTTTVRCICRQLSDNAHDV